MIFFGTACARPQLLRWSLAIPGDLLGVRLSGSVLGSLSGAAGGETGGELATGDKDQPRKSTNQESKTSKKRLGSLSFRKSDGGLVLLGDGSSMVTSLY